MPAPGDLGRRMRGALGAGPGVVGRPVLLCRCTEGAGGRVAEESGWSRSVNWLDLPGCGKLPVYS